MKKIVNTLICATLIALMMLHINDVIYRHVVGEEEHIYQVMAVCEHSTDKGALLVDVHGNAWYVEVALEQDAEYMMWIDDCGNDDVEDDEIVNVWREVRD